MSSVQKTTETTLFAFAPAAARPEAQPQPPAEHRFLIRNIDWATYKTIADALPDRHYHMSYDGEDLELMTNSGDHGQFSQLFNQFIVVLTEETETPRRSCGDMTMNREDLERGIEPDQSFYLVNEPKVRGKKIDLEIQPPPDLGVEVDLTTDSRRRMGIYAKIGVPEIWRYDGENATIYQRQPDGQYAEAERSSYFPFLAAADLARFLQQRFEKDESSLVRSFREWVRKQSAT